MSKQIYWVVGAWLLLAFILMANGQPTNFYNQYGQPIGTATNIGGTTFYNNQYGQPVGTATNIGGTTFYNNQYGQPVGTAIQPIQPTPVIQPQPFFKENK